MEALLSRLKFQGVLRDAATAHGFPSFNYLMQTQEQYFTISANKSQLKYDRLSIVCNTLVLTLIGQSRESL